jgi:hypothetical protein
VDAAKLLAFFQSIDKLIRNSNFRGLFEATSYHPVLTFTLLSEGRPGVTWEPTKAMLFLPLEKYFLSVLPFTSFLHISASASKGYTASCKNMA